MLEKQLESIRNRKRIIEAILIIASLTRRVRLFVFNKRPLTETIKGRTENITNGLTSIFSCVVPENSRRIIIEIARAKMNT